MTNMNCSKHRFLLHPAPRIGDAFVVRRQVEELNRAESERDVRHDPLGDVIRNTQGLVLPCATRSHFAHLNSTVLVIWPAVHDMNLQYMNSLLLMMYMFTIFSSVKTMQWCFDTTCTVDSPGRIAFLLLELLFLKDPCRAGWCWLPGCNPANSPVNVTLPSGQ